MSEGIQAYNYQRLCWEMIRRDWFERVFFYELRDDPAPDVDNRGIVRADNSLKQAYYAYREFVADPKEPGPRATGCTCGTGQGVPGDDPHHVLKGIISQALVFGPVAFYMGLERLRRMYV